MTNKCGGSIGAGSAIRTMTCLPCFRRSKLQSSGWLHCSWRKLPLIGAVAPCFITSLAKVGRASADALCLASMHGLCHGLCFRIYTGLFCRLLRDLHIVEANLEFWQNRLHQGSHLRFMLFGQGPLSFAHDVVSTLERKHKQRMTSATDKIERRVRVMLHAYTSKSDHHCLLDNFLCDM